MRRDITGAAALWTVIALMGASRAQGQPTPKGGKPSAPPSVLSNNSAPSNAFVPKTVQTAPITFAGSPPKQGTSAVPVIVTTGAISFAGSTPKQGTSAVPVIVTTGAISFAGNSPNASTGDRFTSKTISTNPISFTGNKTR